MNVENKSNVRPYLGSCLARNFRIGSSCVIFFFAFILVYFVLTLYFQVRRSAESKNPPESGFESTVGDESGVDDNTEHSTGKMYLINGCCGSSGINLV